jgi:YidC/Oxa1 family membrane protein insertase
MDKNTIIAVVGIFLIVLVFQFFFLRPRLEERSTEVKEEILEEQQEPEEEATEEISGVETEEKPGEPGEIVAVDKTLIESEVVSIETNFYSVKISNEGAAVISFRLKEYLDQNDAPVELVEYDKDDIRPFEAHFDRLRNSPLGDRTLYQVEKISDTAYSFYRDFQDENDRPFRFSKTYVFEENEYMFDLKIKLSSLDEEDVYLNNDSVAYTMVWGPVLGPISVIKNRYNITTQGYHENGRYRKIMRGAAGCSLRRGESRYMEISRIIDWVGVTNRYFFIGVLPDMKNYIYSFDQRTEGKYFFGISHPYFKGEEVEDIFKIYAGPKQRKLLRQYGNNFEAVMSGRVLKPIVIFLEFMIKAFYSFTKNYGLAIILMTIVIKIILHPLTNKSFQSMRRMSALQPKVTEIRERYKSNPQQMNKEIQALYRKEKINPMGGCLPMILQLPIFYALYTLLSGMVELRNESFLWIKDLSLPDTVATIKASIPLLGYKLGTQGYTDINVLPFVMTGTTLLQSKLTSGDQSAQQGKMMTYLFPIVFFFIFWNMPSGLVLYWTIQNVLTIGQQYYIDYKLKKKKKLNVENAPVKKRSKKRR